MRRDLARPLCSPVNLTLVLLLCLTLALSSAAQAGQPAARLSDMHVCPMVTGFVPHVGGPIITTAVQTVLIGGLPAATLGDTASCVGPPDVIVSPGAPTVLIGGRPAARMGDMTAHGGTIVSGDFNVLIGTAGAPESELAEALLELELISLKEGAAAVKDLEQFLEAIRTRQGDPFPAAATEALIKGAQALLDVARQSLREGSPPSADPSSRQ